MVDRPRFDVILLRSKWSRQHIVRCCCAASFENSRRDIPAEYYDFLNGVVSCARTGLGQPLPARVAGGLRRDAVSDAGDIRRGFRPSDSGLRRFALHPRRQNRASWWTPLSVLFGSGKGAQCRATPSTILRTTSRQSLYLEYAEGAGTTPAGRRRHGECQRHAHRQAQRPGDIPRRHGVSLMHAGGKNRYRRLSFALPPLMQADHGTTGCEPQGLRSSRRGTRHTADTTQSIRHLHSPRRRCHLEERPPARTSNRSEADGLIA